MDPAISVIVPVFNVKGYLKRCIDSILHQTFQCFEVILVDDGSDDGSGRICDDYQTQYDNIKVIHKQNAGLGFARNSGMEIAKGRYIMFVDSDDYISHDCLQNLYEAADGNEADCVVAGFTVIYSNGRQKSFPCARNAKIFEGDEIRELLLGSLGSLPGSKKDVPYGQYVWARLYKRQVITEHQVRFVSEREYIAEDIIFNTDFLKFARCAVIVPDVSYHYNCAHVGSLSKRHRSDRVQMEFIMKQALEKRLDKIFSRDVYMPYLHRLIIIRTAFAITQEVLYHDHVDKDYPMRASVKSILTDERFHEILRGYPWWKLPFLRRLLVGTMRFQKVGLLIFLIRMQQRLMDSSQNI